MKTVTNNTITDTKIAQIFSPMSFVYTSCHNKCIFFTNHKCTHTVVYINIPTNESMQTRKQSVSYEQYYEYHIYICLYVQYTVFTVPNSAAYS
jgi:hypothetical protein